MFRTFVIDVMKFALSVDSPIFIIFILSQQHDVIIGNNAIIFLI